MLGFTTGAPSLLVALRWGLLTAFVELIQNRVYDFWSHSFVRCAPEIEKLFESVARSCMTASRNAGVEGVQ